MALHIAEMIESFAVLFLRLWCFCLFRPFTVFFSRRLLSFKWNIISFADHPPQRPVAKPPNHRVTPTDHLTGTGANVGASAVFPPTLPSPPAVQENRRPTSFGANFPPAPMQGNFNSPTQSPFGGFGLSGGWGSGVWAPNSSSASGSGGTSPGAPGLQVNCC